MKWSSVCAMPYFVPVISLNGDIDGRNNFTGAPIYWRTDLDGMRRVELRN
jgi:hypothetical protein